ncbi:MAG: hypothetical protein HY956_09515 [Deltaproteobacteria bacterium]|nr:hypothetical protein [Deltaproteobacteria bacterium]
MRDGVTIWTEGGSGIGMGHVVRCMNVAAALSALDIPFHFLVNSDSAVAERLEGAGLPHITYPIDGTHPARLTNDIVLIDTRKDVSTQIAALKGSGRKVVLLDNTVSKGADLVIVPSALYKEKGDGVRGGAEFVIVGERFRKERLWKIRHSLPLKVLVTMGGADPFRLTELVLKSLKDMDGVEVTTVIGPAFSPERDLKALVRWRPGFRFVQDAKDLSQLMAASHVAVTAVGTTIYELACMGVPSVLIGNYESDSFDLKGFEGLGVSVSLGHYKDVTPEAIRGAVTRFKDEAFWRDASEKAQKLVDGKGSERIAALIGAFFNERPAAETEGVQHA